MVRDASAERLMPLLFHPIDTGLGNPRLPLSKRLTSFKKPTLFLYGETDWMPITSAFPLEKSMSNCKVKQISNAGHQLYLENPNEFNDSVLEWLRQE